MPQGDQTGPNGQGPMTGRRMGLCAGFNVPGFMNSGLGRGRGMGRGFRRFQQFAQPIQQVPVQKITKDQEKQILEEDLEDLKSEIEAVQKRLKEISSSK